jgi:hypothetical protein
MSTTTLYAELIVVGSGAAIFVLLLCYSLFGDPSWFGKLWALSSSGKLVSLVPVLPVVYFLGIVMNSLGYVMFKGPEEKIRKRAFPDPAPSDNESKYSKIRNTLYTSNDKDLIEAFAFRRSKVRICRGWFVNCILIIGALILSLFTGRIPNSKVWVFIVNVELLMAATGVSWRAATDNELDWLKSYAKENARD